MIAICLQLDTGDSGTAAAAEEAAPRELPPWMLRDGIDAAGETAYRATGCTVYLTQTALLELLN